MTIWWLPLPKRSRTLLLSMDLSKRPSDSPTHWLLVNS